jgi:hypothetical protein
VAGATLAVPVVVEGTLPVVTSFGRPRFLC